MVGFVSLIYPGCGLAKPRRAAAITSIAVPVGITDIGISSTAATATTTASGTGARAGIALTIKNWGTVWIAVTIPILEIAGIGYRVAATVAR
jgi:hypothetical protein